MAKQTNGKYYLESLSDDNVSVFPYSYLKDFVSGSGYVFDAESFQSAFVPSEEFARYFEEVKSVGKSCGNDMMWSILEIQPNKAFQLHSHPNIEINYVLQGTLYQKYFPTEAFKLPTLMFQKTTIETNEIADALPMEQLTESSVKAGSMLLNLPGSTHQSFTKEEGAVLLCLFSSKWNFIKTNPTIQSHLLEVSATKLQK